MCNLTTSILEKIILQQKENYFTVNHEQDPIRSHCTLYLCCTLVKKHAPRWIRQGNSGIEVHLVVKNNEIITTGLNSSLANELAITQNAIDRFSKVETKIKKKKKNWPVFGHFAGVSRQSVLVSKQTLLYLINQRIRKKLNKITQLNWRSIFNFIFGWQIDLDLVSAMDVPSSWDALRKQVQFPLNFAFLIYFSFSYLICYVKIWCYCN